MAIAGDNASEKYYRTLYTLESLYRLTGRNERPLAAGFGARS